MGRYGFVSGGAQAGGAIVEELMRRAMLEQQARQEQFARQKEANDQELGLRAASDRERGMQQQSEQAAAALALQKQQEGRIAEAQAAAQKATEDATNFRKATTIANAALPGDNVDDQTRQLLEGQGYGGQIKKVPGIVQQGPLQNTDENGIPNYGVIQQPDSFQMRGGSQYLSQRAAAEERAALAGQNQTAAAERAAADRQTRELIAQMAASGNAETRALGNQLKQLQIDAATDKLTTTQEARTKAEGDAQAVTKNALDLVDRLEKHPGFNMAYGNISSRFAGASQDAVDAGAIRDQLVAALALPNLGALKGPMSDKDVVFVKDLATRLGNPRISEKEARQAITEARTFLQSKLGTDAVVGGGGSGEYDYVNGKLVPRR